MVETVLKFLLLSELICLRLQASLISSYFQEVHLLAHANYVSTGQTVKSRPVVSEAGRFLLNYKIL